MAGLHLAVGTGIGVLVLVEPRLPLRGMLLGLGSASLIHGIGRTLGISAQNLYLATVCLACVSVGLLSLLL